MVAGVYRAIELGRFRSWISAKKVAMKKLYASSDMSRPVAKREVFSYNVRAPLACRGHGYLLESELYLDR